MLDTQTLIAHFESLSEDIATYRSVGRDIHELVELRADVAGDLREIWKKDTGGKDFAEWLHDLRNA